MTDSKLLSPSELVAMCKSFMTAKKPVSEPDPLHEGWDSVLVLTPRMVADILEANNEI
jgi:hypothetical protein